MSLVTLDAGPGADPALQIDGVRIPADVFMRLCDADAMLRSARTRVAAADQAAQSRAAATLAEAHRLGFAQGRADGVAAVLGTLALEDRVRELLADRLTALVMQCLRTLLSDLGDEAVLRQRVIAILAAQQAPGRVVLHIAPSQVADARTALAVLSPAVGGPFSIVADPTRARDALLLETQVGFLDANLELTLRQWKDLIEDVLRRAVHPTAESQR